MSDLHELKKEANDLGVSYNKNITFEKLQEKIDAFYESKEDSAPVIIDDVDEADETEKEQAMSKQQKFAAKRDKRERDARKTRIVSIVDNDQRQNNFTTTCTVNCSNEYFDLGTRILPLNENIEVALGHIKTLQRVKIPLHVKDIKTGLSSVRLRPRYTISFIQ